MLWEFRDQSLLAILYRLLSPTPLQCNIAALDMAAVGRVWLAAAVCLAVAMNAWFVWALRSRHAERRDAAILSLLLIFMTVCNPLGWKHNSIALLFPTLFVLDSMARSLASRRALLALLVPAIALANTKSAYNGSGPWFWLQVAGGAFGARCCWAPR